MRTSPARHSRNARRPVRWREEISRRWGAEGRCHVVATSVARGATGRSRPDLGNWRPPAGPPLTENSAWVVGGKAAWLAVSVQRRVDVDERAAQGQRIHRSARKPVKVLALRVETPLDDRATGARRKTSPWSGCEPQLFKIARVAAG